ncbi:MAG: protein-L-isoaspartate(D-aspartate) O-methyltransferase [Candidatus Omnitrophica bacterium]|nr:protein-L-isoaspartate(D-aspartate) O-methyltransferase [Candidatus Omnitrophota bacterium]
MIERQLERRGIVDPRVLKAFRKVPRHLFVPKECQEQAYEDYPLPIGFDQTISQPYMVALMTQTLAPTEASKVLEIGTGSGYQTAILAELSGTVFSIERIGELSRQAEERLRLLGYHNVSLKCENGMRGWPQFSPYNHILVTCASRTIPLPLLSQLESEGRLVIPLGGPVTQVLTLLHKQKEKMDLKEICECAFVPLVEDD